MQYHSMQTTAAAFRPSVAIWWSSLDILLLFIFTVNGAKAPQNAASEHRMVMQDRAILHVNLMNTAGMCRDPRPVIVYPQATNNKIYYPRGTLLHRCSDQTGCCPNTGEVCRPDAVADVEKVFFVNHLTIHGQRVTGHRLTPRLKTPKQNFTTLTESLPFVNHTRCKCVKLAPNAIEHDDRQSVVSRPLVATSSLSMNSTNSFLYHMLASVGLITLLMLAFFVYKCFAPSYDLVRHDIA